VWVDDKVTAVSGWVPVIKELRDNTPLANDAVVLSGSSAADLEEAWRALGAGRTSVATPFRLLLPHDLPLVPGHHRGGGARSRSDRPHRPAI
jgi:hypothetical protein